jgi:hypothetical protein
LLPAKYKKKVESLDNVPAGVFTVIEIYDFFYYVSPEEVARVSSPPATSPPPPDTSDECNLRQRTVARNRVSTPPRLVSPPTTTASQSSRVSPPVSPSIASSTANRRKTSQTIIHRSTRLLAHVMTCDSNVYSFCYISSQPSAKLPFVLNSLQLNVIFASDALYVLLLIEAQCPPKKKPQPFEEIEIGDDSGIFIYYYYFFFSFSFL